MKEPIYVGWESYGRMALSLARKIEKSGGMFDLVIGIARGGIPLSMVLADHLNLKMDMVNVKSYTGIEERVKPAILSTINTRLEGKHILLVDDLIEHGDTMVVLSSYLARKKPSGLATAVMFTKPWNRFKPDFSVREVDRWVVFPWEIGEARRTGALQAGQKETKR
ncbi:MAG: hypothetical protein M1354_03935 [Candidatus Marsarchaeota archaeon]|jgi:hypoxanthine phosphoribosyltransferase|nr:hypothetical protein [Candidatus Marsarchaeota archaeon]